MHASNKPVSEDEEEDDVYKDDSPLILWLCHEGEFFIWLCCEHLHCIFLFVCVVNICSTCCQIDEYVFLICWCFFHLHVFSEVAACVLSLSSIKVNYLLSFFK